MNITQLGEPRFPSPKNHPVSDGARIPQHIIQDPAGPPTEQAFFEIAGPRVRLFFDPKTTRAGIVTCGGLCPGLNNVIRSLFLELRHGYGVQEVLGFRRGYQGLDPARGAEPVTITSEFVLGIHRQGGTVLGTSRGPVDTKLAVENLIQRGVNVLFTIGGDGTQRGGVDLFQEAQRRGHPLAVVGVPKTIDNDVAFVSRTFGYVTAVEKAAGVLDCAHTEARSVENGIALVKVMGRHAGFIAAGATVASQDVNFTLIPEVPFSLAGERGFLAALERRIRERSHAVIVVAEGAGQDLLDPSRDDRDASGNVKLKDIGVFLRQQIEAHFKAQNLPVLLRYFDPSYEIRSCAADSEDAIFCDLIARHAVHAAMAGKTGLVIGHMHGTFIHVPIEMLTRELKRIDPDGILWQAVLAATGQAPQFK
ncbi:MAG TPA: ATP-dependent 6-phosphofructokinase [Terrimicrobiaceae bacterium]|nr:ATP-dependent 6-phosphofructokinase [Terrimicrobiaceae bacterium]